MRSPSVKVAVVLITQTAHRLRPSNNGIISHRHGDRPPGDEPETFVMRRRPDLDLVHKIVQAIGERLRLALRVSVKEKLQLEHRCVCDPVIPQLREGLGRHRSLSREILLKRPLANVPTTAILSAAQPVE
jgi:hypothetical protein